MTKLIKIIVGQPGSGKTLSMVNKILESKDVWHHNINGLHIKGMERLRWEHIMTETKTEKGKLESLKPNWEYWQKVKMKNQVNICIDEIGNIYNARMSMSKRNIVFNAWLSQIRKLTSSTGNHYLYLVLQRLKSLDVFARDLADEVIQCTLFRDTEEIMTSYRFNNALHRKMMPVHMIKQRHFIGNERMTAEDKYENFLATNERTWNYTSIIRNANGLMQYYDSYDIVDFGVESYV